MHVVTADDNGAVHLGGLDDTRKDATTDGNIAGEGALLVDVLALDRLTGGAEAKTNVLVETLTALARDLLAGLTEAAIDKKKRAETELGRQEVKGREREMSLTHPQQETAGCFHDIGFITP